jgi:hypothetical protein
LAVVIVLIIVMSQIVVAVAVVVMVVVCAPVGTRHALYESDCSVGPEAFVVENLKSKPNATGECCPIHVVPRDVPWARLDRIWDDDARKVVATRKGTGVYSWCRMSI